MSQENGQLMRFAEITLFILLSFGLVMLIAIKSVTGESFREIFATLLIVILSLATGCLGYRCFFTKPTPSEDTPARARRAGRL